MRAISQEREPNSEAVRAFVQLEVGWTMLHDDGWYAYCNDERALGPFPTEPDAARAGLEAWGTRAR